MTAARAIWDETAAADRAVRQSSRGAYRVISVAAAVEAIEKPNVRVLRDIELDPQWLTVLSYPDDDTVRATTPDDVRTYIWRGSAYYTASDPRAWVSLSWLGHALGGLSARALKTLVHPVDTARGRIAGGGGRVHSLCTVRAARVMLSRAAAAAHQLEGVE